MTEEITVLQIVKAVLLWASPVVVLVGILTILYSNYEKLEETFGKEVGGIRKKIIPAFETNIYTFHQWLIGRKTLIGVICIIAGMTLFFILKK
jgi:hypothetical protein